MATNQPTTVTDNEFQLFDCVATRIMSTFDLLRDQLTARRDALLNALRIMKENYISKETTRKASISELETIIRQMQELSVKENTNLEVHRNAIEGYRRKIEEHQTPTKHPCPFFYCPTLAQLETQIAEFGDLKEGVDYSLKKEPVIAVGKKGKADNELNAIGLALDELNQLIYIADCDNSRVQVVSFNGNFLKRFGKGILKSPFGIAVTEDNVFITDINLHALLQFSRKDYKLVRRTVIRGGREGELDYPGGLCTDSNGDVFVADCDNHRVSVFSRDLKFLNCLITQQLRNPQDVKVTQDSVVVLYRSSNCIHFFSRSGDLIRSCVTQGKDGMVYNPQFFCLDTAGNILITDYYRHSIKILSPSGQLIHTIGKEGHGRGELYRPFGICVTQSGTIFVVSDNRNSCLQSF